MALDIAPAEVIKGESVTIGRSSGGLGLVQGLKVVRYGGERVVVNDWSSSQVNVTVPSGAHLANSATGYKFTISGLLSGTDETDLIPLNPSEGWDFVEVASPAVDDGSIVRDTALTIEAGVQIVFPEFPGLSVGADTQFTFDPMPEAEVSIPYFVIGPDGAIMAEELFTFSPEAPMAHPVITLREGVDFDINAPDNREEDLSGDIGG